MLAIDEQRATCNMPCVKKCYFPHEGDVSTEHLRSSSVSNVIKAVTAFFYGSLIGGGKSLAVRNPSLCRQWLHDRNTCKVPPTPLE